MAKHMKILTHWEKAKWTVQKYTAGAKQNMAPVVRGRQQECQPRSKYGSRPLLNVVKVSASDSRQQLRLRTHTANCNWIVGTAGKHRFKIKTMLPNKQRIWSHYEAISLITGKMWREHKERDLQIECNSYYSPFWWERRAKCHTESRSRVRGQTTRSRLLCDTLQIDSSRSKDYKLSRNADALKGDVC